MAEGNTALVARAFELFNARDGEGLAALMEPDGELFPYLIDERRGSGYRGCDGLRQYLRDVEAQFASFTVEIEELRDLADDVVFARGRLRGRLRAGATVDMPASWLWTVRQGRVVRMQAHPTT